MNATPAASLPPAPRWSMPRQTLAWMARPGPFLSGCRARFGDIFTVRLAYEGHWVIVADPGAAEEIFTADMATLSAGEANAVLRPILGSRSLLLLDDAAHLARRRLLLPCFGGERLRRHAETLREIAEAEIAGWPRGEVLPLLPRMQRITLEMIMRAVFGAQAGALDTLRGALHELLDRSTDTRALALLLVLGPRATMPLSGLARRVRGVDAAIHAEIARRRRESPGDDDDILASLLQARFDDGRPMSDGDIRDQLVTLLVAGYETTAAALAWAVERLVRAPAVAQRLSEELAHGEQAYLEAVCRETLRLRPVLPIVGRRLREPTRLAGWTLPAGTKVAPCVYLIHRRPETYPQPERFWPERFLAQPPGTYTWIPFGGGTRRCLGAALAMLELRVVLSALFSGARLARAREPAERVRRRALILAPARGAEVVIQGP